MNYTLEIALDYLRRGLSIIPLQPNGKEPCSALLPSRTDGAGKPMFNPTTGKPLRTWQTFVDCHASVAEVRQWFSKVPNANIGILTGKTSRVIVLDIDGAAGEQFVAENGGIPTTPTTKTGRGRHVWFRHPGFKVKNFVNRLPELDLRGDGGYVCAYPSIHPSGRQYFWEVGLETPFAPVPAWLLALMEEKTNRSTASPSLVSSAASAIIQPSAYAGAALRSEAAEVAATMINRNNRLYIAALKMGSLIGAGKIARDQVERALMDAAAANKLRHDDGDTAAWKTIGSGISKGMESPRGRKD